MYILFFLRETCIENNKNFNRLRAYVQGMCFTRSKCKKRSFCNSISYVFPRINKNSSIPPRERSIAMFNKWNLSIYIRARNVQKSFGTTIGAVRISGISVRKTKVRVCDWWCETKKVRCFWEPRRRCNTALISKITDTIYVYIEDNKIKL